LHGFLRAAAERLGHDVVAEFKDAGISGAKGRFFSTPVSGRYFLTSKCFW
jgi:hypothetical protein